MNIPRLRPCERRLSDRQFQIGSLGIVAGTITIDYDFIVITALAGISILAGTANGGIVNSIKISVSDQLLRLQDDEGRVLREYPVSTSKYGTGSRNGSQQTPLGLHRIKDKLGGAMPVNEVFVGRVPQGSLDECRERGIDLPDDVIMSRILWLEGMEPDRNQGGYVDTFQRYIYIHGTNHEESIGTPSSIGCIRMRNEDVVDLYRLVEIGSEVLIEE